MTAALIWALLALAVLCAWLACAGFARLRTPLGRMHCVAFVTATAGTVVTVAAFVADGASIRAGKALLLLLVMLFSGAGLSHATGRALTLREEEGEGP